MFFRLKRFCYFLFHRHEGHPKIWKSVVVVRGIYKAVRILHSITTCKSRKADLPDEFVWVNNEAKGTRYKNQLIWNTVHNYDPDISYQASGAIWWLVNGRSYCPLTSIASQTYCSFTSLQKLELSSNTIPSSLTPTKSISFLDVTIIPRCLFRCIRYSRI